MTPTPSPSPNAVPVPTKVTDTWILTLPTNTNTFKWTKQTPSISPDASDPSPNALMYILNGNLPDGTPVNNHLFLMMLAPANQNFTFYPVLYPPPVPAPYGNYTTNCTLPLGLTLDSVTGIISGIPTVQSPPYNYPIQFSNEFGTGSTNIGLNIVRPYTGSRFTSSQDPIDPMRRKADILQYYGVQTNNTKSQKWSNIVNLHLAERHKVFASQSDNYTNPNTSNLELVNNTLICARETTICAPTTASDVPGPMQMLCFNSTLPRIVNPVTQFMTFTQNTSKYPQLN